MSEDVITTRGLPADLELGSWVSNLDDALDTYLSTMNRAELADLVKRLSVDVARQEARVTCITEIAVAMGRKTAQLNELLGTIMDKVTEVMGARRSTLFMVDAENDEIWSTITQGMVNTEIRLSIGEGVAGWVARHGTSLNIKDAYSDPRFNPEFDAKSGFKTQSILCQPVRNQSGEIIAVAQVLNGRRDHFSDEDEYLLSALCAHIGIALENNKLYREMTEQTYQLQDLNRRLEHKIAELDLLYEIEKELNEAQDFESLIKSITRKSLDLFQAEAAALTVIDEIDLQTWLLKYEGNADDLEVSDNDGSSYHFDTIRIPKEATASGRVIETGQPWLCNHGTCGDGRPHAGSDSFGLAVHSVMAVPLFDEEKAIIGALEIMNHREKEEPFARDELKMLTLIASRIATALVNARQQLELDKASRLAAIGQALSGVVHDLKNPIAIINGYVQLMARVDAREKRDEYAATIKRQFEILDEMTRELLHFARGEYDIRVADTDLASFFHDLYEILAGELLQRDMNLIMNLGYKGTIKMDAPKMQRAILNLARNAADAMEAGGTFTIGVELTPDEKQVIFTFTDTGKGIPEEIRERLFESFVTQGKPNGTGLGLAIVKSIVEEHGGTISFETALHEGTTFTIRIPYRP